MSRLNTPLCPSAILILVVCALITPGFASAQEAPPALRPPDHLATSPLVLPQWLSHGEDADSLPTLADLYRLYAAVLDAQSNGDHILIEANLGELVARITPLLGRPEYLEDERFAEFYQTVLTEHERHFGPSDGLLADPAEVFAVREQTFAALNELENPLEEPADLPSPARVAPTQVPMTINRAVTTAMEVLLEKRPETLANWASRAHTWFPLIEKVFAEEGIPDELKYLAMIESGLRPAVRSRASAVGMWQFIAATGRTYGLIIDGWVDERMDPEKATRAAARHLRDLYQQHGDWHVAMSGYNCSPRCLNRAKRNARRRGVAEPTFWDMYPFLPRETRNYVPQYIATSIMLSNPDAYGIEKKEAGAPFEYELVPVRGSLALREVAEMAGATLARLNELNPALRRGYLPPSARPYPLRLPTGTSAPFLEAYAALPPEALRPPGEHIVRSGDTLSEIAATYGVSVSRLRSDNRLRGSLIHPGQRLIVPTSDYALPIAEAVAEAEPVPVSYGSTERRPIHSTGPIEFRDENSVPAIQKSAADPQVAAAAPQPQGRRVTYTVRRGDTLSEIAEAHGVGLSRVRSWNGVRSRIREGQQLVLYVSDDWRPAQSASASTTEFVYTVRSGDTLSEIAAAHGVGLSDLRRWNGISNSRIRVGQRLRTNAPAQRTHEVQRGDTLTEIAKTYNVTIAELRRWNALDSDRIYPGSRLVVADSQ